MARIKGLGRVELPKGEINGRTGKVRFYDLVDKKMKWGWPVDVREKIAMKVARLLTTEEVNAAGSKMTVYALPETPKEPDEPTGDDPKSAAAAAAARETGDGGKPPETTSDEE